MESGKNIVTGIFPDNWHLRGNFLLAGMPYFFIGNYIKKHEIWNQISKKKYILLLLLGVLLSVAGILINVKYDWYGKGILI